jgi:hypothetical protein
MVEKQSLETDYKIHIDETAALARPSENINHLEKGAIGTPRHTSKIFSADEGFLPSLTRHCLTKFSWKTTTQI